MGDWFRRGAAPEKPPDGGGGPLHGGGIVRLRVGCGLGDDGLQRVGLDEPAIGRSRDVESWAAPAASAVGSDEEFGWCRSGVVTACVQRLVDAYPVPSNIDRILVAADRGHSH